MGQRKRVCSIKSPGRRFLDWTYAWITSLIPHNLLSPSEVILLSLGFLLFVVIFISFFMPVYLSRGTVAAGYIGSVIPIIYLVGMGHYVFNRACHRLSSTLAFENGAFHYERWPKQADSAWTKIVLAFREIKMREQYTRGDASKSSSVRNNAALTDTTNYDEYAKAVRELLKLDEVVDLPAKLLRSVAGSPMTYYESKLIRFIFPPTREERRIKNRRKIVYIPLMRMWVWRSSLIWVLFFLFFFLFPLAILIPVSYKDGPVPSPSPSDSNSSTSRILSEQAYDRMISASLSIGSFRLLQGNPYDMYSSSYYALLFFSVFFPFVWLVLFVLELLWQLFFLIAATLTRLFSICFRKEEPTEQDAEEHGNGKDGAAMAMMEGEEAPMGAHPKKKTKLLDPKRRNVEVAKTDIEDALDFLYDRWQFQWEPFGKTVTSTSTNSVANGSNDAQFDYERNISVDLTVRALEQFQSDNINPDPDLFHVRALALSGRILCLRRDLVAWLRRVRGGLDSVAESFEERFGMSTNDVAAELQNAETTLSRHMSNYSEIARNFYIQYALLISRVIRRQLDLIQRDNFENMGGDFSKINQALRDLDGLLLGIERRDENRNEVQWQQNMRDLEERLEGMLIDLRSMADESKTKDAQFLCWIGLARIQASRNIARGEMLVRRLKRCLQDELKRKNSGARRLADNVFVRKCCFWVSFSRVSKQIQTLRKKMENQAGSSSSSQRDTMTAGGSKEGSKRASHFGEQLDQLIERLEIDLMDLIFGELDQTKPVKPVDRKLATYLNKGLRLPNVAHDPAAEDAREGFYYEGNSNPGWSTQDHRRSAMQSSSDSRLDGNNINSNGRDHHLNGGGGGGAAVAPVLVYQEVMIIERVLAQAYTGQILAQLLQVREQTTKKRNDALQKIGERVEALEQRFSKQVYEDETVRYVRGLAKLEDLVNRVNREWDDQSSKRELSGGKHQYSNQMLQIRENCFRMGVSFQPDLPRLAQTSAKPIEELAAKSYAGLVLMNVLVDKLEEAEDWTDKLRTKLPLRSIDMDCVQLALAEYRKARLHAQLGGFMYRLYLVFSNGKLMLNLFLFWLVFVLPIILGLTFVLNHRDIPDNPRVYNWFTDSVFWLQFFGLSLPLIFILFVAFRWTMECRAIWFGEKETEEEMQHEVVNTLVASQIARKLEARQRMLNPEETVTPIAPKFGGEYPMWCMGEHLVTAPGRKKVVRRGYRLKVTRMAIIMFLFVLCPIVALPPTLVILLGNNQLSRDSPYYYVCLVVTILYPLATLLFFSIKLIVDAVPQTIRNAKRYYFAYFALFVVVPLLLGVPLLTHTESGASDGLPTTCLFVWVIVSLLGVVLSLLRDFINNFEEIQAWFKRLTWEKDPIEKLASFTFSMSIAFVFSVPVIVFITLISDLLAPSSQGLTQESQGALAFAIAALEVIACFGCVAACTSGVKLGYIHPRLAASSVLPVTYVLLGGMIATSGAVKVVRRNSNPSNVFIDVTAMASTFESSLWAASAQILVAICGVIKFIRDWEKREMFGYFPDDWELIAPTARFVVEEARDVPFESDDALKHDLFEHGLDVPMDPEGNRMDRLKAEQVLEEQIRMEQEAAKQFNIQWRRRKQRDAKTVKHQLAETVFTEVMHAERPLYGLSDIGNKSSNLVVLKQYRVRKMTIDLKTILNSMERHRRSIVQMIKFRPTHLLDVLDNELHVVNILFKVIHAYPYNIVQEFRWVTSDTVAARFENCVNPGLLICIVEIHFLFKMSIDRSRVFIFDSPEERDDFIQTIYRRTVESNPEEWTDKCDGRCDSIVRRSKVITDSANV